MTPTAPAGAGLSVDQIAELCHETNRAYCRLIGDNSQLPWSDAPERQRQSAVLGVEFHLAKPDSKPEDSHNSWLAVKRAEGWTYGLVKDAQAKEHPCFVPYEDLPVAQQAKDALFIAVVRAVTGR